jgi:hypothetical protein
MNTTYDVNCPEGTGVPLATPTGIRIDNDNSLNNHLMGGYAEDCDLGIVCNTVAAPYCGIFLFHHNSAPDSSEASMPRVSPGHFNIARAFDGDGSTNGAQLTFHNTGGARFLYDPEGDGSKALAFETNDVERTRWFNGKFTHQGSAGDIELNSAGNDIAFTRDGANSITATTGSAPTLSLVTPTPGLSEGLSEFADDAAAAAGSIAVGGLYRTASAIKIRVA